MTAGSDAVRSVDQGPNLNEVPPNSAVYAIDFFEARHRLTESERIAQERETYRQIQESAIRRERSGGLVDTLEEAFYWLISAAALVYLALGIFGL